jgi:RNA polymerase sigma-54 factor
LRIQLKAILKDDPDDEVAAVGLKICALPLELLAKRDFKRLAVQCWRDEALVQTRL